MIIIEVAVEVVVVNVVVVAVICSSMPYYLLSIDLLL